MKVPGYLPVFLILVTAVVFLIKENNSQLKKQLQNLEEALESTRQSAKNEEHKSNLLIAEKVKKLSHFLLSIFIRKKVTFISTGEQVSCKSKQ